MAKIKAVPEDLDNIITCAKWLVRELEQIDCQSLANLFQRTVDDAEIWIHHMAASGYLPERNESTIKAREAQVIHDLLVKYASIENPTKRRSVIQRMKLSLDMVLEKEM